MNDIKQLPWSLRPGRSVFCLALLVSVSAVITALTAESLVEERQGAGKITDAKGRRILQMAIEAAGGSEKFKSISNFKMKTKGVLLSPTSQKEIELTVTETVLLPDKTKQALEVPAGVRVQVLNGESGWSKIGDEPAVRLPDAQAREMKRGLFRDIIRLFSKAGSQDFTVDYLSEETVAGQSSHVLQIKDKSGDFFNLYIDVKSNQVRKKLYRGASEVGLATLEEIYSDYREMEGIRIPFKRVVRADGKRFIESRVVEAALNVELSKNFFEKK